MRREFKILLLLILSLIGLGLIVLSLYLNGVKGLGIGNILEAIILTSNILLGCVLSFFSLLEIKILMEESS